VSRHVAGILLAAGSGTRFGGAKLLAPLRAAAQGVPAGTPVGVAACRHLVAALPDVVAVVRTGDDALAQRLRDAGARTTECARAHEGMGVTLAAGVAATASAAGWIVALADMPWIASATIAAVAARLRDGASIVAPCYRGRRGHPVGFSAQHIAALLALTGDEGAKAILAAHPDALESIDVDDPGVLRDVDRPEDLNDGVRA
jgi:molybdenum cofactor cytidylyltransferase